VRRQLEQRLGSALHRQVTVSKVRMNPFTLSINIQGFEVKDRDGSPFASFDRLYVNANALPLLRKELDFSAVTLERPFASIAIDAKGRLNFQDLLDAGGESDGQEEGQGISIRVEHLRIVGARVAFRDRSRRTPFETTLGPVTLDLDNFRTHRRDNQSPYAFSGETESGERFGWNGTFLLDPIRSKGTFVLENILVPKYAPYYQDETRAEIRSGVLGLRASYELEWAPKKRVLRLVDGSLSLRKLELAKSGEAPLLGLAELDVTGATADAFERSAEVARVALRGGRVDLRREKDGRVNLVDLVEPPGAASPKAGPPPSGSAGGKAPGFRYRVGAVSLENVRVDVADLAAPRPVALAVDVQKCELADVNSDPEKPAQLRLEVLLGRSGRIRASGRIYPLAPRGEIELAADALDLSPFGPYLDPAVDVVLEGAALGAKVLASFDGRRPELAWSLRGEVSLDGLRLRDGLRHEDFLGWRSLRLEGIEATPGRAAIRAVRLLELKLRATVFEDHRTNLAVILRRPPPGAGGGDAPAGGRGEPARAEPRAARAGEQRWSIASLRIAKGQASFVDRSVSPPAIVDVGDIDVQVRGLSSDARSKAVVQASASLGGAPLSLQGSLQPQFAGDSTDLAIQSKAIDLTPLGPYVAKYVGYSLQKGKLDLDLRYTVKDRKLEAANVARIDQFTLGDKSDSPDATSLPVKLGLAVLTDPDGVIRLDVPAGGSIDDPAFSIGRMVWHAVVNLFTKVMLSPFAALGNLFGGGTENLDVLDFPAGQASLDPAADKKLKVLAKALRERPALRLDVEGVADEAVDGEALRREAVQDEVRRAKWSALRRKDPAVALDSVVVQPQEYPRWVEAAWKALPPAPGAASSPPPGDSKATPRVEEMEERLLAAVAVSPEAYRELAARRAEEARVRLLADGGIDPGRVFLVEGGQRAAKEKGARTYFGLK